MGIDSIKKWVTCDVVRLQSVVSWLSVGYQLVVSKSLGRLGYQSVKCQLSGSCQAVVRQLSGSCQVSGSFQRVVRQSLTVVMQSVFRQASGSHQSVKKIPFPALEAKRLFSLVFSSLPAGNKGVNNHANPMHQLNDSQQTEPREQSKGSPNATQLVSE